MGLVDRIIKVNKKLQLNPVRKPDQDYCELEIGVADQNGVIINVPVRIPEGRYQINIAVKMIPRWSRNQVRITSNAFGRIAKELGLIPERLPDSRLGQTLPNGKPKLINKYSAADITQILKRAEERGLLRDTPPEQMPEYLPIDGAHDRLHGIEIYIPAAYYTPVEACRLLANLSRGKLILTPASFGRTVTQMGLKDPEHHGHDEIVAYVRPDSVNKHEITCYRYSARAVMEIFFHANENGLLKSYDVELARAREKAAEKARLAEERALAREAKSRTRTRKTP